MKTKKRINSKVYRFNTVSVIGLTATALLANPEFLEAIPYWGYIILMVLGALANNGFREVTNIPIEGSIGARKLNPLEAANQQDDMDIKDI